MPPSTFNPSPTVANIRSRQNGTLAFHQHVGGAKVCLEPQRPGVPSDVITLNIHSRSTNRTWYFTMTSPDLRALLDEHEGIQKNERAD